MRKVRLGGQLQLGRLPQAADRGVRMGDLVEYFFFKRRGRVVATLAHHPKIIIKILNPGRQRKLGRKLGYLLRLRDINHRTQNETLSADNPVVISGGRHIADESYGTSKRFDFFALDLLAVGPVVLPTSGVLTYSWQLRLDTQGNLSLQSSDGILDRRPASPPGDKFKADSFDCSHGIGIFA